MTSVGAATADANERLFDGVSFFISTTLRQEVRAALHDLLTESGASPCPAVASSSSPLARPPRFDPTRLTHLITDTLDFPEYELIKYRLAGTEEAESDAAESGGKGDTAHIDGDERNVEIVTPAWVTRSYDLQAKQPPRFYSADKALFFSGTVVCTAELPEEDRLAIHSGVLALGGQTRRELTREVTHLICAAEHGAKYEMALKFGTELGMVVVLPHWFEESLKLSTLVPVDIYRFPSPPFSTSLRDPSSPTVSFATRLHEFWRARLSGSTTAHETGPPAAEPNTATAVILGLAAKEDNAYYRAAGTGAGFEAQLPPAAPTRKDARGKKARPFDGKRVYLASDLGLSAGLERALKARVRDAGGECWSFAAGAEDDAAGVDEGAGGARRERRGSTADREDAWAKRRKAEKRLKESDIVVLRTREGWEFWTAYDANLTIGNLAYLFHCLATSSLPSPLSRLLHYPLPSLDGLPDWQNESIKITVSNYAGGARDYVRALIEALGASFEGTMSKTGTNYLVAASDYGDKVLHARNWALPIVTHCWLEALVREWRLVPPSSHPSHTLSAGGNPSTTHFTALLGHAGYSRAVIDRWAAQDEQREARRAATRDVRELQREEEDALRLLGEEGADAAWEEEGERTETGLGIDLVGDSRPPELPRLASPLRLDGERESPALVRVPRHETPDPTPAKAVAGFEPPAATAVAVEAASPAPVPGPSKKAKELKAKPAPSKAKEREPLQPRRSATREADAMDVDEPEPSPGKPATPPPPIKKRGTSKKPHARSSSLSELDGDGAKSGSGSDDEDSPPPSANAMPKSYAQISDENLVAGGSKRGAAAKARAALVSAIIDRNAYEQELKSSGRKGSARRSRSPRKAMQERGEDDGDEEDEPVGVVKRGKEAAKGKGKRAARGDLDENEDDDVVVEAPKKKKAKTAPVAPAHRTVKAVQASAAATTTQEGGVVSSFDKPPNAKPPAPAAKKIKVISTGLGLDKQSAEIQHLKRLGASWTERPSEATHLIVKGIGRTEKFLCCLPFAPKIVNMGWVDACRAAGKLVDEAPYLLRDPEKEASLGDTLEAILGRARKGPLFAGRSVYITRQVQPEPTIVQKILQASGAVVHIRDLTKALKKIVDDRDSFIISTPADRREWEKLAAAPYNRRIYTVEAVFVSVLHQDLTRGFVSANRVDPQLHDGSSSS